MTGAEDAYGRALRASAFVDEWENNYEEEVRFLNEQLQAQAEHHERVQAEMRGELASRNGKIGQLIGDSLDVELRLEKANALLAQERSQRAALQAMATKLREERDVLTDLLADANANKADLRDQLDAANWRAHELEVRAAEDKCLIPEHRACARCGGSDTFYAYDVYSCRTCGEDYEPYPRRDD